MVQSRKLIYAINMSLNGCCDHTAVGGSKEVLEYYTHLVRKVDLFIFGRKTYQLMVPYWPDIAKSQAATGEENEYALAFEDTPRVVFSKTLNDAGEDKKTRIVRGNLQNEILKLKQEPGGDILTGGISLPSQLIELGLVDEFLFVFHPAIVGGGTRLLEGVGVDEKLHLTETKVFESGSLALRYVKK